MTDASLDNVWVSAEAYDSYLGRWSRKVASRFLDWIGADDGLRWLDVGCGTGALSQAIVKQCAPGDLIGIDLSEGFLNQARKAVSDTRARFEPGSAEALPLESGCRDIAVSGLVLNFVPDKAKAVREMRRVVGDKGIVAFYVWDYPGGGLELLRDFWDAAAALDLGAEELTENENYTCCEPERLRAFAVSGGLEDVRVESMEVPPCSGTSRTIGIPTHWERALDPDFTRAFPKPTVKRSGRDWNAICLTTTMARSP